MFSNNLSHESIWNDLSFLLESVVIGLDDIGESVLSGDEDLLTAWELELSSSQGFTSELDILWLNSNGKKNLSDSDSGTLAEGFTESTSHTLLESICTSAGQHLVDSNNMPWMNSDSHMEMFSTDVGSHVLVASNSGGLKSFRCNLFLLVANQMDASWEIVELSLLLSNIVNSKFRVWYTSIKPRLWIRLILLVPVAPGWSSSHYKLI